jgi:hypothetical protein
MAASKNLTAAERKIRGSAAGLQGWANTKDRSARAQKGADTKLRKLEDEVDPDHAMSAEDRRKAAINLRKSRMALLALKASKAKRKKSQNGDGNGRAAPSPRAAQSLTVDPHRNAPDEQSPES